VSFPATDAEHTWHEEALAAPAELAMCLRWGLARVLRVSGGNATVRGLLSWDMYVEWSEAELRKRLSPPRLYIHNVDSRF